MRKVLRYLPLLLVIPSLLLVAFAHPGRTDSNGGHTDHSTGEYHYHHGYSAHDHYDMDGDGIKDCPYDFDDKTNHNSTSGQSSSKNSTTKKKSSSGAGMFIAAVVYVFFMFVLPFLFK